MKSNKNAIYHGGVDGGHYFEIMEKKEDKFRIKIYMDYNQKLYIEGIFKPISDSCGINLTLENIQDYISTYNDDTIFLENPLKKKCKLIVIEKLYDWHENGR